MRNSIGLCVNTSDVSTRSKQERCSPEISCHSFLSFGTLIDEGTSYFTYTFPGCSVHNGCRGSRVI